jgi:hypothetical protein
MLSDWILGIIKHHNIFKIKEQQRHDIYLMCKTLQHTHTHTKYIRVGIVISLDGCVIY